MSLQQISITTTIMAKNKVAYWLDIADEDIER